MARGSADCQNFEPLTVSGAIQVMGARLARWRLLVAALLALLTCSCDAASRYLAGMDDPENFTWERPSVASDRTGEAVPETTREGKRERSRGMTEDSTPAPLKEPTPAPAITDQATVARDLKDCEASSLPAGGAGTSAPTAAPTIGRSEDSPVVAACMADKGYQKVYRSRSSLF